MIIPKFHLLFLFFSSQIFSQIIDSPEFVVTFNGVSRNSDVTIIADDSVYFKGRINNHLGTIRNYTVTSIFVMPRKVNIIIDNKTLNINCNPKKPYLYITRRMGKYFIRTRSYPTVYR